MGNSNPRGQGTIDVLILLFLLSALIIAALAFARSNHDFVSRVQLSKEKQ